MFRRSLNVRPVKQCGNSRVHRAEGADEIPDVCILWTERRSELSQHESDVPFASFQWGICSDIAKQAFPDMAMRIYESRHDDHIRRVDHLRSVGRKVWTNPCNFCAFDQNIRISKIAK